MTGHIMLRSPASMDRRQPLLASPDYSSSRILRSPASMIDRRNSMIGSPDYSTHGSLRKVRIAEVAGGTTAECAAVCCCCPCTIVNLVVLAVYKVPAGLCRKALRKKRRLKLKKQGLLPPRKCGCEDFEFQIQPVAGPVTLVNALDMGPEIIELEKEMWDQFYNTGFWRSSSQRSEASGLSGLSGLSAQ